MPAPAGKSRKRPANSQDSRPAKKVQTQRGAGKSTEHEKKRRQPVTQREPQESSSEDENEIQEAQSDVEEVPVENGMDVDPKPKLKDANGGPFGICTSDMTLTNRIASKESHKAQKELQSQRKASKPNAAVIDNAKRIWAEARKQNITPKERQKHIRDLMEAVKGRADIVVKHDGSRIFQTVSPSLAMTLSFPQLRNV